MSIHKRGSFGPAYQDEVGRVFRIQEEEALTDDNMAAAMGLSLGEFKRFCSGFTPLSIEMARSLGYNLDIDLNWLIEGLEAKMPVAWCPDCRCEYCRSEPKNPNTCHREDILAMWEKIAEEQNAQDD